jgi:hypothetical protein
MNSVYSARERSLMSMSGGMAAVGNGAETFGGPGLLGFLSNGGFGDGSIGLLSIRPKSVGLRSRDLAGVCSAAYTDAPEVAGVGAGLYVASSSCMGVGVGGTVVGSRAFVFGLRLGKRPFRRVHSTQTP